MRTKKNILILLMFFGGCFLPGFLFALEKVSIELKWFHQFQFAGIYMAKEKGFYQAAGLDLTILPRDIKSTPLQDVLSNKVQFGISDSTLIRHRLAGHKVVLLAAIFQHSPLVLISLDQKKIYSPLQLRNKKVMYQKGVDDAIIVGMFAAQGLSRDDFTFIPHSFKDDALITNQADAISAYLGDQTYFYEQRGMRLTIINPANYGVDLYGDLLFTSEEYFLNNTQQVLAFREATIKGWKYALSHPEETVNVILKKYATTKSKAALLHESKHIKSVIAPNLIELGHVNKSRLNRIKSIYQQWEPSLLSGDISGLYYKEHLFSPSKNLFIIKMIVIFSVLFAIISLFISIKLKKHAYKIKQKLSSTSKKFGGFQDVILHKFDTTLTNENDEIMFVSASLLDNLGYQLNELVGQKKHTLLSMDKSTDALGEKVSEHRFTKGLWQDEVRLKTKDGNIRIYDRIIDDYTDKNGDVLGVISVYIDHTDKKVAEKRASTDPLTAIANRYQLDLTLKNEIKKGTENNTSLALILFDIDHFKQINDKFGHIKGDEILKHVAKVLSLNIDQADTVGRWGGEEFLVISPQDKNTPDLAIALANKLRILISQSLNDEAITLNVSAGVTCHKANETILSVIERVDNALYEAKKIGRNVVVAN